MNFCIRTWLVEGKQFEHVYQPIWDLDTWNIFGYEALMRVVNKAVPNVEHLFQRAREEGCLYELDTMAIENSISNFPFSHLNKQLLFLNIYPSTILHEHFEDFLDDLIRKYPVIRDRIVFELNETRDEEDIWETAQLKEKIQIVKNYGFYVAIDDVGKEVFTLQRIIEFQPDYIKLDRYFSEELAMNKEKQQMISLLANYCKRKMMLVLEGIEKEIDLAQAKLLRVPAAQGYLLGEPKKLF